MSTKIYNGYKLPRMTLDELYAFGQDFKKRICDQFQKEVCILQAEIATEVCDLKTLGYKYNYEFESRDEKIEGRSLILAIVSLFMSQTKRAAESMRRDGIWDFSCNLILIPRKDHILALLYSQRESAAVIFQGMEGVVDYSYWDNTDRPDELTDEEWDARRDEWGEAFGGWKMTPAEAGMSIECPEIRGIEFGMSEKILQAVPSLEERANRMAKRMAITRWYDSQGIDPVAKVEWSDFMQRRSKLRDWLDSTDGQQQVEEEIVKMKTRLKPTIEKSDLDEEFPNPLPQLPILMS